MLYYDTWSTNHQDLSSHSKGLIQFYNAVLIDFIGNIRIWLQSYNNNIHFTWTVITFIIYYHYFSYVRVCVFCEVRTE